MTTILFRLFDPRPQGADANEAIFALGKVFGVEVTVPALADRCEWGNIDPQHTGADLLKKYKVNKEPAAAIEVLFTNPLNASAFEDETLVLATVRADLDSIGTMVVIAAQVNGENYLSMYERAMLVAQADKFARGGWRKSDRKSVV